MNVIFHKRFEKMAVKLIPKVKQKMVERVSLFAQNPLAPQLRVHALYTPYKGSFSIDITGDYRAIYELIDDETALFTHIGTHSQLYR
jgi:addiction module RelE/StbE family toxin